MRQKEGSARDETGCCRALCHLVIECVKIVVKVLLWRRQAHVGCVHVLEQDGRLLPSLCKGTGCAQGSQKRQKLCVAPGRPRGARACATRRRRYALCARSKDGRNEARSATGCRLPWQCTAVRARTVLVRVVLQRQAPVGLLDGDLIVLSGSQTKHAQRFGTRLWHRGVRADTINASAVQRAGRTGGCAHDASSDI